MITHQEIKDLVAEWGLREDVIEKDYVIGWILWGISTNPQLNQYWAFKGGTSLKKCYIETWRFSEDLDFSVIPDGPVKPEDIAPLVEDVIARVHEESGIDFSAKPPVFKHYDHHHYTEGSVYYRGPRNSPSAARIKLDISGSEQIVCQTVLRNISHPYSDSFPEETQVRCYAFEEVFAEKIRAMGERGRPRDLYDIVHLFRRKDVSIQPEQLKSVLEKKCQSKGIPVPTLESIQSSPTKSELISEWENMLAHQLLVLPDFNQFWNELPNIFKWLNGILIPAKPAVMAIQANEDRSWTPPPTISSWGIGVPLESIRFAAVNHLCVELRYDQSTRLIEPYSLRRTKDDNLILHAVKVQTGESRSYRVDRIQGIKVTNQTFVPRYEIEFTQIGLIQVPPVSRTTHTPVYSRISFPKKNTRKQFSSFGMKYIFQCSVCGKKFTRSKYDATLNPHKGKYGDCYGRIGIFIGNK